jgi:putative peptidoglycan lipid II flippase
LFVAVAVNVALKVLLMDHFAQAGLAFATSVGAWVNLTLLVWFASRRNLIAIDQRLRRSTVKFSIAGMTLALGLYFCERPVMGLFEGWPSLRDEMVLVSVLTGAAIYGIAVLALFRCEWREMASIV